MFYNFLIQHMTFKLGKRLVSKIILITDTVNFLIVNPFQYMKSYRDGRAKGAAGAVAPPPPTFFPNVMLKQLCFKTLVVKFPREAYKMLYFLSQAPPPS